MTTPVRRSTWAVAALFVVLSIVMAWPASVRPGSGLIGDSPDSQLFLWTLAWNTHAFLANPLAIFDANIYYPHPRTLAFSENLIGSSFLAAPVIWVTGDPVAALNIVSVLACALCGLGAYVLARQLQISVPGAILAGLIFAFAPSRFFRIAQLHINTVQWVPFTLAYLHAYLNEGRARDLRIAVALFSLQALTSGHGAAFLVLSVVLLLASRIVLGAPLAIGRRSRDLGVPGVLLFLPAVLVLIPYERVQAEVGLVRALEPRWGATWESFLASPSIVHTWLHSWIRSPHVNDTADAFLFVGYVALLFTAVALWPRSATKAAAPQASARDTWSRTGLAVELGALVACGVGIALMVGGPIRLRWNTTVLFSARDATRAFEAAGVLVALRVGMLWRVPLSLGPFVRSRGKVFARWRAARRAERRTDRAYYGGLLLLCLWLSIPGPLSLWPQVYSFPVFNFIRASSRFMVLGTLAVGVLAGMGFDRIGARLTPARRHLLAAAAGVLLLAESAAPVRFDPFRWQIPAVDRWLATRPTPFVVAELPAWDFERYQTAYMLHSTAHWQKTIHGYSGHRTQLHTDLYRMLRRLPEEAGLRTLREMGVDYIVVHTDFYEPHEWEEMELRLSQFGGSLTLEHVEGPGRVYALRGGSPDGEK